MGDPSLAARNSIQNRLREITTKRIPMNHALHRVVLQARQCVHFQVAPTCKIPYTNPSKRPQYPIIQQEEFYRCLNNIVASTGWIGVQVCQPP